MNDNDDDNNEIGLHIATLITYSVALSQDLSASRGVHMFTVQLPVFADTKVLPV